MSRFSFKSFPLLFAIVFLWIVIYLSNVLNSFSKIHQINRCIKALLKYLSIAKNIVPYEGQSQKINNNVEYQHALYDVLHLYPLILKYLSVYSPTLGYNYSNEKLFSNSLSIYYELLKKRDFLIHNFKESLNPVVSLKRLVLLPSALLNWIGFSPNAAFSKISSLLIWILVYLSNLYSREIKDFLTFLFNHFTHT